MPNFKEIQKYQGQCIHPSLLKSETSENDICPICYQIMSSPISLSCPCNQLFGKACLQEWIGKKENICCPYCRCPATCWEPQPSPDISLSCPYCSQWEGAISKYSSHVWTCQSYRATLEKTLKQKVQEQKGFLSLEITPHLISDHNEIYEKYVENWAWLEFDSRNWKWWWWCSNKWWNNNSCKQCNRLWHKYEKEIDAIELQRVYLINLIREKFEGFGISFMFEEQV